MQTLNILNSTLNDIKGFSGNTSLRTFNLTSSNITNLNGQSFANSGSTSQFEIYINGTTISTISNFSSSRVSSLYINNSSITTINSNAFANISYLKSVITRGTTSINTIDTRAFYNCTNLATLDLNSSCRITTLGNEAFRYCDLSATFDLSNQITTMRDNVFANSNITTAIFTENLSNMGSGVYLGCKKTTSINFRRNSSITKIPNFTFYDNVLLKSVVLPSHVVGVGDNAFMIDSYIDGNNGGVQTINLENISTLGVACFKNSAIESYSVNANIRRIPTSAFENCSMMTSLQLYNQNNSLEIGENAFKNTKRINNVGTQIDGITIIGNSAFEESGIYARDDYFVKLQIRSIGNRAFYHCKRLEWFPFYSYQGYYCDSIRIGDEAFAYANLTKMGSETTIKGRGYNKVNSNFTSVGTGAFKYSGIRWIARDSFEANIRSIPSYCFQGIGNSEYEISDNSVYIYNYQLPWTNIGSYAFEGISKTKRGSGSVTLNLNLNEGNDRNVTNIGSYAFANAKTFFDHLKIGRVQSIGDHAFYNSDVYSVDIERKSDVYLGTAIGEWAFGHSTDWNNNQANNIRNRGAGCLLGESIDRARTIGNYAFYNLGGVEYSSYIDANPLRYLRVWNNDRYNNLISIGNYALARNKIGKYCEEAPAGNGMFPTNLQVVESYGFYNTYIDDNASFICPYGIDDFWWCNNFLKAGDHAFDNFIIYEHDSEHYHKWSLKLPPNLKTVGYYAFAAIHYNNFCNNFYLASIRYDPSTFNSNPLNGANQRTIYFNGSSFPNNSSGHNLVDSLKRNFKWLNGDPLWYQ